MEAAAFADAVDPGDVGLVLYRAGAEEGAPVLAAFVGPVGDDGEEVGVGVERGVEGRLGIAPTSSPAA